MLEQKIQALKEELNGKIEMGIDSDEVYKLSLELDKLIVEYYNREVPLGQKAGGEMNKVT